MVYDAIADSFEFQKDMRLRDQCKGAAISTMGDNTRRVRSSANRNSFNIYLSLYLQPPNCKATSISQWIESTLRKKPLNGFTDKPTKLEKWILISLVTYVNLIENFSQTKKA